jgi:NAD(P)-dependent dehydrogenase (short-subunit alcohol dehydrogenase family)
VTGPTAAQVPRVALVTGATRGIGRLTAQRLAERGYDVLATGRDARATDAVAEEIGCRALELDVADPASIARAYTALQSAGVTVDVLVNNAGICLEEGPLSVRVADFSLQMATNAFGPWLLMRAFVPGMVERGFGRVVNVSSGSGSFDHGMDIGSYSVSKATLNALTVTVAQEVPRGVDVLVNAVCPDWAQTDMGGPDATVTVEQAVAGVVWAVELPAGGPTGGFFRDGEPIAW